MDLKKMLGKKGSKSDLLEREGKQSSHSRSSSFTPRSNSNLHDISVTARLSEVSHDQRPTVSTHVRKPSADESISGSPKRRTFMNFDEPELNFKDLKPSWAITLATDQKTRLGPLHKAAWRKDKKKVIECLLDNKYHVDHQDETYGNTALHFAIEAQSEDLVKLLVVGDPTLQDDIPQANIDIQNREGRTPLMMAILFNETRIALYLIESKADLTLVDNMGCTALHFCILMDNKEVFDALLAYGAPLDVIDREDSLLHHALRLERENMALQLIKCGHSLKVTNEEMSTPLHYAARYTCETVAASLLENGADPCFHDLMDRVPFECVPLGRGFTTLRDRLETAYRAKDTINRQKSLAAKQRTRTASSEFSISSSKQPALLEQLREANKSPMESLQTEEVSENLDSSLSSLNDNDIGALSESSEENKSLQSVESKSVQSADVKSLHSEKKSVGSKSVEPQTDQKSMEQTIHRLEEELKNVQALLAKERMEHQESKRENEHNAQENVALNADVQLLRSQLKKQMEMTGEREQQIKELSLKLQKPVDDIRSKEDLIQVIQSYEAETSLLHKQLDGARMALEERDKAIAQIQLLHQQSRSRDTLESPKLSSPTVIFEHHDAVKRQLEEKIKDLEFKLRAETSNHTKIANLERERQNLEETNILLVKQMSELESKIEQLTKQGLDRSMRKSTSQTNIDANNQKSPGYVYDVREKFNSQEFKREKRPSTQKDLLHERRLSHSSLSSEQHSIYSTIDIKEPKEIPKSVHDRVLEEKHQLEQELECVHLEVEKTTEALDSLKRSVESVNQRNLELEESNRRLLREVKESLALVEEAGDKNATAHAQLEHLHQEHDQLLAQYEALERRLSDQSIDKTKALEQAQQDLLDKTNALEEAQKDLLDKEQAMDSLQTQMIRLQGKLSQMEEKLQLATVTLQECKSRLEQEQIDKQQRTLEIQRLQTALDNARDLEQSIHLEEVSVQRKLEETLAKLSLLESQSSDKEREWQQERADMQHTIEEQFKEIKALEDQRHSLTLEHQEILKEVSLIESDYQRLQQSERESVEMRERLTKSERESVELKDRIKQLQDNQIDPTRWAERKQLDELSLEKTDLQQQLDELRHESTALLQDYKELAQLEENQRISIETKTQLIANLESERQEYLKNQNQLQEENKALNVALEQIKVKFQELEPSYAQYKSEFLQFQQRNQELSVQVQEMQETLTSLRETLKDKEAQLQLVQSKKEQLEAEFKQQKRELEDSLQEALDECKQDLIQKQEQKISLLQQEQAMMQTQLLELRQENETLLKEIASINAIEQEFTALLESMEQQQHQMMLQSDELMQLQQLLTKKEQEAHSHLQALQKSSELVQQLNTTIHNLEKETKLLNKKCLDLEQDLKLTTEERNEREIDVIQLQSHIRASQEQLESFQHATEEWHELLVQKTKTLENLKIEEENGWQMERQQIVQQLEAMKQERDKSKASEAHLRHELQECQGQLDGLQMQLSKLKDASVEQTSKNEQSIDRQTELQRTIIRLEDQNTDLRNEIQILKVQLIGNPQSDLQNKLQEKIQSQEQELKVLQQRLESHQREREQLESDRYQLERQKRETVKDQDDVQRLRDEIKRQNSDMERQRSEIERLKAEMERQKSDWETKPQSRLVETTLEDTHWRLELKQVSSELRQLRQTYERQSDELDKILIENRQLMQQNLKLREKLTHMTVDYETALSERNQHEIQLSTIRTQLVQKEAVIRQLSLDNKIQQDQQNTWDFTIRHLEQKQRDTMQQKTYLDLDKIQYKMERRIESDEQVRDLKSKIVDLKRQLKQERSRYDAQIVEIIARYDQQVKTRHEMDQRLVRGRIKK